MFKIFPIWVNRNRSSLFPIYYLKRSLAFYCLLPFSLFNKGETLLMSQLSKVTKTLLGLFLAPLYLLEEREREKKLRDRLVRYERKSSTKQQWFWRRASWLGWINFNAAAALTLLSVIVVCVSWSKSASQRSSKQLLQPFLWIFLAVKFAKCHLRQAPLSGSV